MWKDIILIYQEAKIWKFKKKEKFLLEFIDIYGSHIRGKSRLKKIF